MTILCPHRAYIAAVDDIAEKHENPVTQPRDSARLALPVSVNKFQRQLYRKGRLRRRISISVTRDYHIPPRIIVKYIYKRARARTWEGEIMLRSGVSINATAYRYHCRIRAYARTLDSLLNYIESNIYKLSSPRITGVIFFKCRADAARRGRGRGRVQKLRA